jgi:hypothetical protein
LFWVLRVRVVEYDLCDFNKVTEVSGEYAMAIGNPIVEETETYR